MAIVSISEAARLVRRGRASLYRDIDKGRLSKTVSLSGETGIETSELVRAYGKLHLPETKQVSHETSASKNIDDFARMADTWTSHDAVSKVSHETSGDSHETAIFNEKMQSYEHRIELLERINALEKTVRVDTVAALRAQLADKDSTIKSLQNQVYLLGYSESIESKSATEEKPAVKKGWWSRLIKRS